MVRIPVYNQPQIQPQGIQGGQRNPNAPAAAFGMGLGESVERAAGIAQEANHQADMLRVQDAFTGFENDVTQFIQDAKQIKGRQIIDPKTYGGEEGQRILDAKMKLFNESMAERTKGLSSKQQQMFQRAAERKRLLMTEIIRSHEDGEIHAMTQENFESRHKALTDQVGTLAVDKGQVNGRALQQGMADIEDNLKRWAAFNGKDPEPALAQARSGVHSMVIQHLMAANNPKGAEAYFGEHRDALDEKTRLVLGKQINDHILANDVQTRADEISAMGIPLDQQESKAAEIFKNNPEGLKDLRTELEHRFHVQQQAQRVSTEVNYGELWDMRFPTKPGQKAVGMPEIMRSKQWNALNGEQRNELRAKWEAYARRNEGREQESPEDMVAKYATYKRILDDTKGLAQMDDRQIVALTGILGQDLTKKLLDDKRKAAGNLEDLQKATLTSVPIKELAIEYGIVPTGKFTPEHQARMGLLRNKLIDAIREEQAGSTRELTPERKEEIARNLLVKVKTSKDGFFPWSGKVEKPLFQIENVAELDATDEEKSLANQLLAAAMVASTPANVNTMIQAIRAKRSKQGGK